MSLFRLKLTRIALFRVRPVPVARLAMSSFCTSDQSSRPFPQNNMYLRRNSGSHLPGFPTGAQRTGDAFPEQLGIEVGGPMYSTLRIQKCILSATMVAMLLFAGGSSTPAAEIKVVTVGKIEIPAVGIATRVLEGDDARILRLSVGHIPGTAVPGPTGNVGLAGHNNTFFRPLQKVNVGDEIRYSTTSGTYTYRVVSLRVVLPSAIEVLDSTPQPTLTLVTCYPFNSISPAPLRLIVHAELVADSQN